MAKAAKAITKITDLIPDEQNANKGTERGGALLESSLRKLGAGRSVLADRNGRIIAGNKTVERAVDVGLDDVIVVQSDGTKLIVVQRTDLDLSKDKRARELATLDNRVGQLDLDWNVEQLLAMKNDGFDLAELGFAEKELGIFNATADALQQIEQITYRIVIECDDEKQQATLLKKFEEEGLKCQLLMS